MQVLQDSVIPAFLGKLWRMVNDPKTDHLICWSPGGNTFIIQNQAQFWYELLPSYYKHNNMSSFVRQLNMYGFHKISSLENAGGTDKDDSQTIQFYHPYFQRDAPEKLKNIKRKSSNTKPSDVQSVIRADDLDKVLSDVKQLRGKQSSVDSQLSAMKQENTVLWRELALLREKHVKQQQIVNKLIQFLVTMVQPAPTQRMGVSVKRRMPLMIHESPAKKNRMRKSSRNSVDGGPTIHELDPEAELSPEQLLQEAVIEDSIPLINSPNSQIPQDSPGLQPSPIVDENTVDNTQNVTSETVFWDKPEFVNLEDEVSENEEDIINNLQKNSGCAEKVFLNPDNRDTLIGSLMSPETYNVNSLSGKNIINGKKHLNTNRASVPTSRPNMLVPTKNQDIKISNGGDLDQHLDNTQSELDQLKEILDGCNTFDANTLLGLFNDNNSGDEVRTVLKNKENEKDNPLVSENESDPTNNLIDFTELFDEDLSQDDTILPVDTDLNTPSVPNIQSSSLDTPLIGKNEPKFPTA